MTDNLRIWNRFCRTEANVTKNFNKGGFPGTDINPTYRLKCLTELFGPQGTGWGWTIHSRWRETWPSRFKDGAKWIDYDAPCCFVELSLWYIDEEGHRRECSPQIGGTEADLNPDECWKMSITDAIGKCCVALGIAADVYMGQFDGKYHRTAERQPSQPQAAPKPNGEPRQPRADARSAKAPPPDRELVVMTRNKLLEETDRTRLLDVCKPAIETSNKYNESEKRSLLQTIIDRVDQLEAFGGPEEAAA